MPTRYRKQVEQPLTAAAVQLAPQLRSASPDPKREVDFHLSGDVNSQTDLAWYFYERIPELRYIARYVANSLSQARLFVGRVTADPYNPERVGPRHPANEILETFAGGFEGQSELLDRIGLHLTVTGDSILAGPRDPNKPPPHPFDQFRVYSTNEIFSRNGQLFYRTIPGTRDTPLPDGTLAVRIWRPHPRRFQRADSPVLSSFTVLREIDLLDQHVHASAVSRLAGAGILLLPDEIALPSSEMDTEGLEVDDFVRTLTEVMSIAIKNRESAAAMVPIMLRGQAESLDKIRHLEFSTPFDERVPELRNVALRRLALGMDVPPEVLLGMSESTQWSAWQTDESTVRLHTLPLLQMIANSLTVGWLRPKLEEMRLPANVRNEVENLTVWFDISNLRVRPNVTEEVQALFDRFQVGGPSLRNTTGFSEAEKPTKEELEEQILFHLLRESQNLKGYAINTLTEKGLIDLPPVPAEGPVVGRPPGDNAEDINDPRGVPGERSQDKQTEVPSPPPVDTDPNNNEVGR